MIFRPPIFCCQNLPPQHALDMSCSPFPKKNAPFPTRNGPERYTWNYRKAPKNKRDFTVVISRRNQWSYFTLLLTGFGVFGPILHRNCTLPFPSLALQRMIDQSISVHGFGMVVAFVVCHARDLPTKCKSLRKSGISRIVSSTSSNHWYERMNDLPPIELEIAHQHNTIGCFYRFKNGPYLGL